LYRLVFEDILPAGLTYVAGSGMILKNSGWSKMMDPVINGSLLTWNLTDISGCVLTNGSWLSVIFKTTVGINVSGLCVNWVNVTGWQCNDTMVFGRDNASIYISTSENHPPQLSNPIPQHNEQNVSIDALLKITVSDADNDTLSVKFYNASDNSIIHSFSNVVPTKTVSASCNGLTYNTTYVWYVTVNDSNVTVTSANWTFTTEEEPDNSPPNDPSSPSPLHNANGISINPILSVHVSDPDDDALTIRFYNAADNSIIGTDTCPSN
jgi:hypothetical protein